MLNSEPGYAKKRSNLIGHGDELDLWLVPRFTADLTHTPTPDKYFGWAAFSGSGFLIRGNPSSPFYGQFGPRRSLQKNYWNFIIKFELKQMLCRRAHICDYRHISDTPDGLSPFSRVGRRGGVVRISQDWTRSDGCRQSGVKQKGGGYSEDQKDKPVPTKNDFFSNYIEPF